MSKQTQHTPASANTAEHGCGNGFSLASALANGHLVIPATTPSPTTIIRGTPSISRNQLLSIIEDALHLIDEELDDFPTAIPSPAGRRQNDRGSRSLSQ